MGVYHLFCVRQFISLRVELTGILKTFVNKLFQKNFDFFFMVNIKSVVIFFSFPIKKVFKIIPPPIKHIKIFSKCVTKYHKINCFPSKYRVSQHFLIFTSKQSGPTGHIHLGMAMGRSGAKGWDLRPCPARIFLAPSPPRPA